MGLDFTLASTPPAYEAAARALRGGRGPFALDTERAGTFRYDDRAFVVQVHRRGAGTYLFLPEGHRDAFRRIVAPVVNDAEWVLHAAREDLPSLMDLGMQAGTLFDTELAARLCGYPKTNLSAMVLEFTGVTLEKGHGAEDWSQVPLPASWQRYAALDVEYLLELSEGLGVQLDARGMEDAATQEFDHIVSTSEPKTHDWRSMKGVSELRRRESLHVARALWEHRDELGRRSDTAPRSLLSDKLLVAVARELPQSRAELAHVRGFPARRRGAVEEWFAVLKAAATRPRASWPETLPAPDGPPNPHQWRRSEPESWERYSAARDAVAELAQQLDIPADLLLLPAVLRRLVWEEETEPRVTAALSTDAVARRLTELGARPWQVERVAASVAKALGRPPTL